MVSLKPFLVPYQSPLIGNWDNPVGVSVSKKKVSKN